MKPAKFSTLTSFELATSRYRCVALTLGASQFKWKMGFKWSFERSPPYIHHRKKRLQFTSYTPLQNSELPGIFIQVDGDGNSQQSIFFCFAHAQKLITDQVPDWFVFDVLKRAACVWLVDLLIKQDSKSTWFILLVKRAHGWQLKENHFRYFRIGLLQLAITWY